MRRKSVPLPRALLRPVAWPGRVSPTRHGYGGSGGVPEHADRRAARFAAHPQPGAQHLAVSVALLREVMAIDLFWRDSMNRPTIPPHTTPTREELNFS